MAIATHRRAGFKSVPTDITAQENHTMRPAKLILVEGMPGAGKSTLAHALLRQFEADGIAARWWYEEDSGHPVYCFHNMTELRQVVADLASGQHRRVIAAALAQWRQFAANVSAGNEVVFLDGCLFGYLTWSLFPFNVPEAEILDYVAQVAAILNDTQPCIAYIRSEDTAAAWQRLFAARGEDWATSAIVRATHSPYGERHKLTGFDGLIAYWQAYQAIADEAFARLPFPKLALGTANGQAHFLSSALDFLGLDPRTEPVAPSAELSRHVGTYVGLDEAAEVRVEVTLRDGELSLSGVPHLWPQNRLIPLPSGEFAVDSFPFTVRFATEAPDKHAQMQIVGPQLLGGTVGGIFTKLDAER
jgi:thymidylate kinase